MYLKPSALDREASTGVYLASDEPLVFADPPPQQSEYYVLDAQVYEVESGVVKAHMYSGEEVVYWTMGLASIEGEDGLLMSLVAIEVENGRPGRACDVAPFPKRDCDAGPNNVASSTCDLPRERHIHNSSIVDNSFLLFG